MHGDRTAKQIQVFFPNALLALSLSSLSLSDSFHSLLIFILR